MQLEEFSDNKFQLKVRPWSRVMREKMCVCGCVWVCVGVCGCVWVCVGVYLPLRGVGGCSLNEMKAGTWPKHVLIQQHGLVDSTCLVFISSAHLPHLQCPQAWKGNHRQAYNPTRLRHGFHVERGWLVQVFEPSMIHLSKFQARGASGFQTRPFPATISVLHFVLFLLLLVFLSNAKHEVVD